MQTSTPLSPELISEHLSPVAAKMILAAFPDRIQRSLLAHAAETEYPIEMVIEMAIAGFLDGDCINFSDCQSEYISAKTIENIPPALKQQLGLKN